MSSEIPTTTGAIARGSDIYSVPAPPPQEMTVYGKVIEMGTAIASQRYFQISNAAAATPRFLAASSAGPLVTIHESPTSVSSTASGSPAINDLFEFLSPLFGDGSVRSTQSINAGASTSGAQSAATPLAPAWSGPLLWLNSNGNLAFGFTALQSFKIVAGSRSLSEMRTL